MSADRHWIALDHALSRVLSPSQMAQARQRFARRASALSGIYLPRLLDAVQDSQCDDDSKGELAELQHTYRQLSAALIAAWGANDTHR